MYRGLLCRYSPGWQVGFDAPRSGDVPGTWVTRSRAFPLFLGGLASQTQPRFARTLKLAKAGRLDGRRPQSRCSRGQFFGEEEISSSCGMVPRKVRPAEGIARCDDSLPYGLPPRPNIQTSLFRNGKPHIWTLQGHFWTVMSSHGADPPKNRANR
jgi:hypothetical protein